MNDKKICHKCGTELLSDSNFCMDCGTKIKTNNYNFKFFVLIAITLLSLIAIIWGYNFGEDKLLSFNINQNLISSLEALIDLTDSNSFLGSSYQYKRDLESTIQERNWIVFQMVIGYGSSLFGICGIGYSIIGFYTTKNKIKGGN